MSTLTIRMPEGSTSGAAGEAEWNRGVTSRRTEGSRVTAEASR